MPIAEYSLEIVEKQLKGNRSTDSVHTLQTALSGVLTP